MTEENTVTDRVVELEQRMHRAENALAWLLAKHGVPPGVVWANSSTEERVRREQE